MVEKTKFFYAFLKKRLYLCVINKETINNNKQKMAEIVIKKVETKRELRDFIELHYELYKGNE